MSEMNRRHFLAGCVPAAALAAGRESNNRILVRGGTAPSFKRRLAERELLLGLHSLAPGHEIRLWSGDAAPTARDITVLLALEPQRHKDPESYTISFVKPALTISAPNEQALLYGVFDFLERQGVFFGIDGPSYPLEPLGHLQLPANGEIWRAEPRFAVRGLLPWPDFLNCISVYNDEDFRAYFESMLRMRFNTFGMHVYTGANQWAESYLSFEYAGAGHLSFLDNTASNRWGYLPERTSRFGMGAAQFYDGEVFGSDATRLARDPWENAERSRALLQRAFRHAGKLGIRTGIGFEPYQIPDEILRALPPEAKPQSSGAGPKFDIESATARELLETRLAQLLEAYPDVDYVWLWEDENMNWESRKSGQPFSVTPFLQAHAFLRRHAPRKRLVLGGWGGVARHFADFHRRLPGDVIFTCLSDSLGWDPVHEAFGGLEGRERWPIPWLEDDPAMWLTQLHVHRFHKDMNRAAGLGCQGMLGIHWRHRIVDPTAGFLSRFGWDSSLTPDRYYSAYTRAQGAPARSPELAHVLTTADHDGKLLSTWTGEVKDGHAVTHEFSGDYSEGFTFWNNYEPDAKTVASQKEVAAALSALTRAAGTAVERERIGYLSRHVDFMVAYTEAWTLAHRIQAVLNAAAERRKAGQNEAAAEKVRTEAVPLWLRLAPEVRTAVLSFQRILATRNDLGTLASIQNKFVRLALVRLRLSIKEYLGELPPEVDALYREVLRPDGEMQPRIIVPTRPTLLGSGETVRVMAIVAGGAAPAAVMLHTRTSNAPVWTSRLAKSTGRRTYEAILGPFSPGSVFAQFYFSADPGRQVTAPLDAPKSAYGITLV